MIPLRIISNLLSPFKLVDPAGIESATLPTKSGCSNRPRFFNELLNTTPVFLFSTPRLLYQNTQYNKSPSHELLT